MDKETAQEALARYKIAYDIVLAKSSPAAEYIKDYYKPIILEDLKSTTEDLLANENALNLKLPVDFTKFIMEVGSFQIGRIKSDEYDNTNWPRIELITKPLFDHYTQIFGDLIDEEDDGYDSLKKRINTMVPFFTQGFSHFQYTYVCFDTLSQNKETLEMSLEYFHEDTCYHTGTREIKTCQDTRVFDAFISEYIDELIEQLERDGEIEGLIEAASKLEGASDEQLIQSIQFDTSAYLSMDNPSDAVTLATLAEDGLYIKHVESPTEKMKLVAVKSNGLAIEYIENASEKVQLEAIKNDYTAINLIKKPSDKVKLKAVKSSGWALKYIDSPTDEMKLMAVQKNGWVIEDIENPTEEMKLSAVKQDARSLNYIDNPTEEMKLVAIEHGDYSAIGSVKNATEEMKVMAIKKAPEAILYIDDPSEALQLQAVKKDANSIKSIKNPTENVLKLVPDFKPSPPFPPMKKC